MPLPRIIDQSIKQDEAHQPKAHRCPYYTTHSYCKLFATYCRLVPNDKKQQRQKRQQFRVTDFTYPTGEIPPLPSCRIISYHIVSYRIASSRTVRRLGVGMIGTGGKIVSRSASKHSTSCDFDCLYDRSKGPSVCRRVFLLVFFPLLNTLRFGFHNG